MNATWRNGLIALVCAGMVGGLALWFSRNYERVQVEIGLPVYGEASYNPLYALKKTLQADDIAVDSRQRLDLDAMKLERRDTLLLYSDPAVLSLAETDTLLAWVADGGHLILRTPQSAPSRRGDSAHDRWPPVLYAIGVHPGEYGGCQNLRVSGEKEDAQVFCGAEHFTLDEVDAEHRWASSSDDETEYGLVYARLAHGDGYVDVLADLEFLGNGDAPVGVLDEDSGSGSGGLREGAHRALAAQVLAPNYGHGTVHLVYAAQMPSLWRTLFREGWPAWLPLLLALAGWLWWRMQRFGPLLPSPLKERRSLLEHVGASGEHLFRYGRSSLLYAAVAQAFLMRLRRCDPMAAALAGEPRAEAIAARLNLPVAVVRDAMQAPSLHDRHAFRDRIRTLIQMRNQL